MTEKADAIVDEGFFLVEVIEYLDSSSIVLARRFISYK
jgi:hypothetical protein